MLAKLTMQAKFSQHFAIAANLKERNLNKNTAA